MRAPASLLALFCNSAEILDHIQIPFVTVYLQRKNRVANGLCQISAIGQFIKQQLKPDEGGLCD